MKKYAFIANKNNIKFEIGKRYFLKKYIKDRLISIFLFFYILSHYKKE